MGCRCAERRQSILKATTAIRSGDAQGVASELKFVAQSSIQDAAGASRKAISAARQAISIRTGKR